jgi:hypothetical protein
LRGIEGLMSLWKRAHGAQRGFGATRWKRFTMPSATDWRSFNHIQGSAHTRECAHASLSTAQAARWTGRANSAPRGNASCVTSRCYAESVSDVPARSF